MQLVTQITCKQFLSIGHLELDSVPNIHNSFHFKRRERSVTMKCDVDGVGMRALKCRTQMLMRDGWILAAGDAIFFFFVISF